MDESDNPIWTRAQLLESGWTDHTIALAVAHGRLQRLRRGYYAEPLPLDHRWAHRRLVRATLPMVHADAVISHASAAALLGLPIQDAWLTRVTVTRASGVHGRTSRGVRLTVGELPPEDVHVIDGMPVTTPARTAVDLARELPFEWAVIVCDAVLHAGTPRDDLLRVVSDSAARWGSQAAARAVAFANGLSESPAESMSRVTMHRMGLPSPSLQFEVRRGDALVARCDFGWEALGVIGECDGKVKYGELLRPGETPVDAVMREKRRDNDIRHEGWWPVHWGWAEACHGPTLARLIRAGFANASPRRSA